MNKEAKVDTLLDLADKVAFELLPTGPEDLPLPDLTMKQFRIAILLFIAGPLRMNCIAQILGVSMATTSGIVDRLVEHRILKREHDSGDRRAVVCQLSSYGRDLLGKTWEALRINTKKILMAIPEEKLNLISGTLELLLETGKNLKNDSHNGCAEAKLT